MVQKIGYLLYILFCVGALLYLVYSIGYQHGIEKGIEIMKETYHLGE